MRLIKYFKMAATLVVASLLTVSIPVTKVFSCAQAPPPGKPLAQIAAENALILYDEKTSTEHFIRQAVFDPSRDARNFGFLVPTPTPPTLSTADSELLPQVDHYTKPPTVYDTKWVFFKAFDNDKAFSASPHDAKLEVTEQRVGDMDAAIIQASDAKTLRRWLAEHGYATRPALDNWVSSYVKRGWTITAFKIAGNIASKTNGAAKLSASDNEEADMVLTPVRMTFHTAHPFYPYQEPGEKNLSPSLDRQLRILYVGPQRVSGKLSGETPGMFPTQEKEWATPAKLSRALTESQRKEIAQLAHLGKDETVEERLTLFEEVGDHRPSDKDLYFLPSADQSLYESVFLHKTVEQDAGGLVILGVGGLAILATALLIQRKLHG